MTESNETLYDVLEVDQAASTEEIRRAFRLRSRQTHPDLGGCSDEAARVNHAFEVLGDDGKRASYDLDLEAPNTDTRSAFSPFVDEWGAEQTAAPRHEPFVDEWGAEHEQPARPDPSHHGPRPIVDDPADFGPSDLASVPWPWEDGYAGPPALKVSRRYWWDVI